MASIYRRDGEGEPGIWYIKYRHNGCLVRKSLDTRNERMAREKKRRVEADLARRVLIEKPIRSANLPWDELKRRYILWAQSNLAAATFESRLWALGLWEAVMSEHLVLRRIAMEHGDVFRNYLRTTKVGRSALSDRSINDVLDHLRAIVNTAIRRQWYDGPNPFDRMERIKIPRRLPRYLRMDDVATMLAAAEFHSANMHLFIALCFLAGLRKNEAVNAAWAWVDWENGVIAVQSGPKWTIKDNEERAIPLHPLLRDILLKYGGPSSAGYICWPHKTYRKNRYRVDVRAPWGQVREAAGMPGWCTPHKLRHTFATQLSMAGVDLVAIKDALGHSDVRTSMIYNHMASGRKDIEKLVVPSLPGKGEAPTPGAEDAGA